MKELLVISGALIAVGVSGWLLPYRWNLLRPKAIVAWMLPESWKLAVPKVMGTLCIAAGLFLAVSSLFFSTMFGDERGIPIVVANESEECLESVVLEFPGGESLRQDIDPGGEVTVYVKPADQGRVTLVHSLSEQEPVRASVPIDLGPSSIGQISLMVEASGAVRARDGLIRH